MCLRESKINPLLGKKSRELFFGSYVLLINFFNVFFFLLDQHGCLQDYLALYVLLLEARIK